MTTGAIYSQFQNKDAIFEAIVDTVMKRFSELLTHDSEDAYNVCNMKHSDLSVIIEFSRRRFMITGTK